MQSPLKDPNESTQQIWRKVDQITTVIFALEAMMKIVTFGLLFNGKNSYLRKYSNIFDFIIVMCSIISELDLGSQQTKILGYVKTLRGVRVMRPLRLISRSKGLAIAIQALVKSIPNMVNLMFFSLLFFFIFGVFGVSQFKGSYYHCDFSHVS